MFNLTQDEQKVLVFLILTALIGLGVNYLLKTYSRLEKLSAFEDKLAKINLNKASLEDLINSRCLSPGLAKKIIEYRSLRGAFSDLEDLRGIKGLNKVRLEKFKEIFFVE